GHATSHQGIVLADQNGLAAAFQAAQTCHIGTCRLLWAAWQIQPDGRAAPFLTVDLDVATGLLHEAVDHAQSEPGSLAGLLSGEERFEHLVPDRSREARPGPGHRDHQITAGTVLRSDAAIGSA